MKSNKTMAKSFMLGRFGYGLFLLAILVWCADANKVEVTKAAQPLRRRINFGVTTPSTSTTAASTSTVAVTTAPRVRVILEHGQQTSVDDSSFSNRQVAANEPRIAQARQRKLLNTMISGQYWEPEWMKLSRDEVAGAKRSETKCVLSKPLEEQLNKTAFAHYDKDGNFVELAPAIIEQFKLYLMCMGTCPITYTWEDLGEQFFPRFIRRGFCSNDRPCSWPPGMKCKINQTKTLTIFHHVCDGGDTEISLVNSNSSARLLDGSATANQRKSNDLRSPRASANNNNGGSALQNSRNANNNANSSPVDERRNRNQDKRKKRKNASPGNQSNGNGNGNGNGKRNRNKKNDANQRGRKRDTLRSGVNQAGSTCKWQTVSFPVTSQCACSCS